MLEKAKADLVKHWVSWIGFIGLVIIFFVYLFHNPQQLLTVTLFWVLIVWGMAIESGAEKQYGYILDEERNEPYN